MFVGLLVCASSGWLCHLSFEASHVQFSLVVRVVCFYPCATPIDNTAYPIMGFYVTVLFS